jgi:hypothetical protein
MPATSAGMTLEGIPVDRKIRCEARVVALQLDPRFHSGPDATDLMPQPALD